ncbi:MAG: LamG domain-containing protein [Planctomycetota bacterium]
MTIANSNQHIDFEIPDWGEFSAPPANTLGYRSRVLAHNPLAYWRFGEADGITAFDESGHGHHATYRGGVSLSKPGPLSYDNNASVELDGDSGWIELPQSLSLAVNEPVTVCFWSLVFRSGLNRTGVLSIGGLDSPNRCLIHTPWNTLSYFWDFGTQNEQGRIFTTPRDQLDRWTHVAVVSAGRQGNFKAIYLDGELAQSSPASDGPTQVISGGSIWSDQNHAPRNQHAGRIDELAVFNQVLTAEDIRRLYQSGVGPWA